MDRDAWRVQGLIKEKAESRGIYIDFSIVAGGDEEADIDQEERDEGGDQ